MVFKNIDVASIVRDYPNARKFPSLLGGDEERNQIRVLGYCDCGGMVCSKQKNEGPAPCVLGRLGT